MNRLARLSAAEGEQGTSVMDVLDVQIIKTAQNYRSVRLSTTRGEVHARYYPAEPAAGGVIWLSGAVGGFHSPAKGLYARMGCELAEQGISSLQVAYRDASNLREATLDAMAGIIFLEDQGLERLAIVGHAFGGAVALHAAAAHRKVLAVATLATQSYGVGPVAELGGRCALLLIHGERDVLVPPRASQQVFRIAGLPKRLALLGGAGHNLDEAADQVEQELLAFFLQHLHRSEHARLPRE